MLASQRKHHRSIAPGIPQPLIMAVVAALLVPCATWAFSPSMLPSTAIWTNFFQKTHQDKSTPVHEEDTDGDGVVDFKVFRHATGAYIDVHLKPGPDEMIIDTVILRESLRDKANWVYGFDENDDGQIDMLVRGWFAESKWDQMLLDTDRDGRPDKLLYDLDQNSVYDCMGVDVDADGRLDYLYDMDNKTGEVLNESVGWVTLTETQRREALPTLYYSFTPELQTLTGDEPTVVRATWDFGDGAVRTTETLVPGEHVYAQADTYKVSLDVEFKIPGSERIHKAWYGISLPVEPPPPGPPPLTEERVKAAVTTFFGACGFITADERPQSGPISDIWPDVVLPEAAPVGNALRASAIVAGELQLNVFWWRSDAEADAFLEAMAATDANELPAVVVRDQAGKPFELATKVRARVVQNGNNIIAGFRENGFIVTVSTNRTPQELRRWTTVLYDILHPPVKPAPSPTG